MTDARAALVEKVAKDRYEEKRARLLEAFGDTAGWPEWESLKQTLKDIEIETYAPVIDLVLEEAARALYGCTRFDQEIFDSMAESRDGTYVKIEEAEAAIRALKHSS